MRTVRPSRVEIVEVGPRDGYQSIGPFIPTARKISFLRRLVGTGLRRVEMIFRARTEDA